MREAARLDSEGKCDESEPYYRMALAADASPGLLNNAANHYLLCSRPEQARLYFERLIKINPTHSNANLQLARLAANDKQGEKALAYLAHVNGAEPAVRLLRAEALHWAGKREAALAAMNALVREAGSDPRTLFTLGAAFAGLGRYDRAEETFHAALVQQPAPAGGMQDLRPPGERHRVGSHRRTRRLRNRHGHCPTGEGREQRADLRLIKHQLSSRAERDLIYSEGNISNVVHASLRRVSAEALSEVEGAKSRDPEFSSRPMPLQSIFSKIENRKCRSILGSRHY